MKIILRILSLILLINLGFAAIYGGWMLISDPSGNKFGWSVDIIAGTPFKDFLIPGIILFLVNGILPLVITVLAIIKSRNHEWLIIAQGCILIGWLTAEILFDRDLFEPVMHYPCYATGLLLIVLGILLITKYKMNNGTTK